MQKTETQVYELGYLLLPTLSEENLSKAVGEIKEVVEKNSGVFISESFPKMLALAYEMVKNIDNKNQKFDHAYFGWVKFEMPVEQTKSLTEEIDKKDEVLRSLFIKTIREDIVPPKFISKDKEESKPEEPEEINEEEIDKSIDELVAE